MMMDIKNKELSQQFDLDRDPILTLTQPPTGQTKIYNPLSVEDIFFQTLLFYLFFKSFSNKKSSPKKSPNLLGKFITYKSLVKPIGRKSPADEWIKRV